MQQRLDKCCIIIRDFYWRRADTGVQLSHYRDHRGPEIDLILEGGEWREGTSPSRSLRTVRDSLLSYGSHSSALG